MQLWNGSVSDSVTARLKQDKKCCLSYVQCNTACGYGWCARAAAVISTKLTNGLGRGKKVKVFHMGQIKHEITRQCGSKKDGALQILHWRGREIQNSEAARCRPCSVWETL